MAGWAPTADIQFWLALCMATWNRGNCYQYRLGLAQGRLTGPSEHQRRTTKAYPLPSTLSRSSHFSTKSNIHLFRGQHTLGTLTRHLQFKHQCIGQPLNALQSRGLLHQVRSHLPTSAWDTRTWLWLSLRAYILTSTNRSHPSTSPIPRSISKKHMYDLTYQRRQKARGHYE